MTNVQYLLDIVPHKTHEGRDGCYIFEPAVRMRRDGHNGDYMVSVADLDGDNPETVYANHRVLPIAGWFPITEFELA